MEDSPSPKSGSIAGPSSSGGDFKLDFQDADMISNEAAVHELEGRQYYGRPSSNSHTSNLSYRHSNKQSSSSHGLSTSIHHNHHDSLNNGSSTNKMHLNTASEGSNNKLGTFEGVFIPTTLNVLSILMFLRFGFILGQTGILGMLLLLTISYSIDLLTTLSVSAIATNGTVKGGGAYYMISRSLGPEFGGSIGLVFYVGQVLNA
jgi:potassium/chloride transporter 9